MNPGKNLDGTGRLHVAFAPNSIITTQAALVVQRRDTAAPGTDNTIAPRPPAGRRHAWRRSASGANGSCFLSGPWRRRSRGGCIQWPISPQGNSPWAWSPRWQRRRPARRGPDAQAAGGAGPGNGQVAEVAADAVAVLWRGTNRVVPAGTRAGGACHRSGISADCAVGRGDHDHLDTTDDATHGAPQLSFLNGHYGGWCYLPLLAFLTFDTGRSGPPA